MKTEDVAKHIYFLWALSWNVFPASLAVWSAYVPVLLVENLDRQDECHFLPGESQGQRSLAGYSPWGRKESDMTWHAYMYVFTLLQRGCSPSSFIKLGKSKMLFSALKTNQVTIFLEVLT